MKTSSESMIDCAVERIDLAHWLENLSDRDYRACSRSHRAAGTFREEGTFGSVNVETIGGHLLIQHYLAIKSHPGHVIMRSKDTRAYLIHLVPVTIEVIWTLEVEPQGSQWSLFRCTVETRMSGPLTLVATLAALPFFIRRHVREETALFAEDIARKLKGVNHKTAEGGAVEGAWPRSNFLKGQ